MKYKLLIIASILLCSFQAFSQIKIVDLPEFSTSNNGGYLPMTLGGTTYKLKTDNIGVNDLYTRNDSVFIKRMGQELFKFDNACRISFSDVSGNPSDNTNLQTILSTKQPLLTTQGLLDINNYYINGRAQLINFNSTVFSAFNSNYDSTKSFIYFSDSSNAMLNKGLIPNTDSVKQFGGFYRYALSTRGYKPSNGSGMLLNFVAQDLKYTSGAGRVAQIFFDYNLNRLALRSANDGVYGNADTLATLADVRAGGGSGGGGSGSSLPITGGNLTSGSAFLGFTRQTSAIAYPADQTFRIGFTNGGKFYFGDSANAGSSLQFDKSLITGNKTITWDNISGNPTLAGNIFNTGNNLVKLIAGSLPVSIVNITKVATVAYPTDNTLNRLTLTTGRNVWADSGNGTGQRSLQFDWSAVSGNKVITWPNITGEVTEAGNSFNTGNGLVKLISGGLPATTLNYTKFASAAYPVDASLSFYALTNGMYVMADSGNGAGNRSLRQDWSLVSGNKTVTWPNNSGEVTEAGNVFNSGNNLVKLVGGLLPSTILNFTKVATVSYPTDATLSISALNTGVYVMADSGNGFGNRSLRYDWSAITGNKTITWDNTSGTPTLAGNVFNAANSLVKLNSSGYLPALDGRLLTTLQVPSLTPGAALQQIRTNAAGTAPEWFTPSASTGNVIGQIFLGNQNASTLTTGQTTYGIFSGNAGTGLLTLKSAGIGESGTMSNFYLFTSGTQSSTGALTATLFKNGSATSVVITVPASSSATSYTDLTHTVSIAAGDTVAWQFVNSATATSLTLINTSITFKQ